MPQRPHSLIASTLEQCGDRPASTLASCVPDVTSVLRECGAPIGLSATGGTIIETATHRIHIFLDDGVLDVSEGTSADVEVLLVAGGGCGGQWSVGRAGGGGGGGVRHLGGAGVEPAMALSPGSYPVVVGDGGVFSGSTPQNGEDSSFNGESVVGGARGGWSTVLNGASGGSGGGGRSSDGGTQGVGGAGTPGQGFAGGNGTSFSGAGGGGGATKRGGNGGSASSDGTPARDGGDGYQTDITGETKHYGGGGGGCGRTGIGQNGGAGGLGGGGMGEGAQGNGSAGQVNTGGGGGGCRLNLANAVGGKGIVVIKYPIAA